MGGGPTFYIQEMDLLTLTVCLTILVAATIGIEVIVEKLRESCTSKANAQILNKAISELMILGVVSFITVNVIQIDVAFNMPLVDAALAEFEMAHVWLFFVGLMYISNTLIFVWTLDWVKKSWDKCDAMHTVDVQQKFLLTDVSGSSNGENKSKAAAGERIWNWDWNEKERRSGCAYKLFGSGDGPSSEAEFKVLKLYFIQQHWNVLKHELGGEKKVNHFDYAQYMRTVVTEEIVELLEVSPLTWSIFVIFMWLMYGSWVASGFQVRK